MIDESESPRHPSVGEYLADAPDGLAAAVAVVGFDLAVYVVGRYAPEYLRLLGAGPVAIGLFGSIALALAVAYPALGRSVLKRARTEVDLAVGMLAAVGLVCWLLAPQVTLGGLPGWAWVFAGLIPLELWHSHDVETALPYVERLDEYLPDSMTGERARREGALLGVLLIAVSLLAAIPSPVVAIQVLVGLTAATGVTAVVLRYARNDHGGTAHNHPNADSETDGTRLSLAALRSLPVRRRRLLVGDALVEFATAMVLVFLVITVTSVLEIDVAVLGVRLRPDAYFGVLLGIETAVALALGEPLSHLAGRVGSERVLLGVFLLAALFPIALVNAPTNPLVIGVLFGVFGLYRGARPVRRAVLGSVADSGSYRLARSVCVIPGPLVGGLLYSMSPGLAFGFATVVGIIGVREVLYDVRREQADENERR